MATIGSNLYRHPWESDEQWLVRRRFIERHEESILEEELLCLAQVYTNIEFLGCRYPEEVSTKVHEMGVGLMDDIREKIPKNQGVLFVKGTDEDNQEKKSDREDKRKSKMDLPAPKRRIPESQHEYVKPSNRPTASSYFNAAESNDSSQSANNVNTHQLQNYYTSNYKSVQESSTGRHSLGSGVPNNSRNADDDRDWNKPSKSRNTANNAGVSGETELPNEKFKFLAKLLHEESQSHPNAVQLLNTCVSKQHMTIDSTFKTVVSDSGQECECTVSIDKIVIGSAIEKNKKCARDHAYESVIDKLLKLYPINQPEMTNNTNLKIDSLQKKFTKLVDDLKLKFNKLANDNPGTALNNILSKLKLSMDTQIHTKSEIGKNPLFVYDLFIEKILVGSGEGTRKKVAQKNAFKVAVDNLLNGNVAFPKSDNQKHLVNIKDAPEPSIKQECNQSITDNSVNQQNKIKCDQEDEPCIKVEQHINQNNGSDWIGQDFVILRNPQNLKNESSLCIINDSANYNGVSVKYHFTKKTKENIRCVVKMKSPKSGPSPIIIGEGCAATNAEAKQVAASNALRNLQTVAYTLEVKQKVLSETTVSKESLNIIQKSDIDTAIPESNIGNKLLRMMGWSGGGLGKPGNEGREEPVVAVSTYRRHGLGIVDRGLNLDPEFQKKMRDLVRTYAISDTDYDLAFANDFTKEERAFLHRLASFNHLKSVSRGYNEKRYLVLSKRCKPMEQVRKLITAGGSNEKYNLLLPTGAAH